MSAQVFYGVIEELLRKIARRQGLTGRNKVLQPISKTVLTDKSAMFFPDDPTAFPTKTVSQTQYEDLRQRLSSATWIEILPKEGGGKSNQINRCLDDADLARLDAAYRDYSCSTLTVPEKIKAFYRLLQNCNTHANELLDVELLKRVVMSSTYGSVVRGEFSEAFENIRLWLAAARKGVIPSTNSDRLYSQILIAAEISLYRMAHPAREHIAQILHEHMRSSEDKSGRASLIYLTNRHFVLSPTLVEEALAVSAEIPRKDQASPGIDLIMALDFAAENHLKPEETHSALGNRCANDVMKELENFWPRRVAGSKAVADAIMITILARNGRVSEGMKIASNAWKEMESGPDIHFASMRLALAECHLQWRRPDRTDEHKLLALEKYRTARKTAVTFGVPLLYGQRQLLHATVEREILEDPMLKEYL